jgi:hypothetical protein
VKRLKLGKEKPLKSGKEKRLKLGKDKRFKFGKALAVAAPMTAKAEKDTNIALTRLEAACFAASGCLSPGVSLSGVSATCVPYESARLKDFSQPPISKQKMSRREDDPATTFARWPSQIRFKS